MLVPPPKWTVDEIPDLSGKVVIVTGGNANIGRETVKVSNTSSESKPIVLSVVKPKALLVHNAKVYLAARNEQKAMAVKFLTLYRRRAVCRPYKACIRHGHIECMYYLLL